MVKTNHALSNSALAVMNLDFVILMFLLVSDDHLAVTVC